MSQCQIWIDLEAWNFESNLDRWTFLDVPTVGKVGYQGVKAALFRDTTSWSHPLIRRFQQKASLSEYLVGYKY